MENNNSEKNKKKKVIDTLLLSVAGVLLVVGVFLTLRQYVFIPGSYVPPPAATLQPTLAPVPTATPQPTPFDMPYPAEMYFTDREVMCEMQPVGIITEGDKAGKMDTLDSPELAAWYEPGPIPGEAGNSLINGHVRWKGVAGTFSVLPDMKVGEKVVIEYVDGSTRSFTTQSIDFYPYDSVPAQALELDFGGKPRITLISCTGTFNHSAGTSSERVLVVCTLDDEN
ncbi:MAG: class F sortase [Clostridia bacterium]